MSQNLVSLSFTQADVDAIDDALATLEAQFARLIVLSPDDKRGMVRMGGKSEAFCRQTLIVLEQNSHIVPPGLDLVGAAQDLTALDLLRPRFNRLRQLAGRAEDTEAALGSDLMSMALEGYALAKVLGKGAELETLKNAMSARFSRRSRSRVEVAA
jgi:hypothetical protein